MVGPNVAALEASLMSEIVRSTTGTSESRDDDKVRLITDFWNQLRVEDEPGATTWGVLEPLEREVTEAMQQNPPDIRRAQAVTADAMFRISGIE